MKYIALLTLIFGCSSLSAQVWYDKSMRGKKTDSFIITLEGDTIPGKLEFDRPHKMARRITFYPDNSGEKEKYRSSDIKGFGLYGKIWRSKMLRIPMSDGIGNFSRRLEAFLLPVVEDGPIQLYYHYYNGFFMSLEGKYIPAYAYVMVKEGDKTAYMSADEDWLYDNQVYSLLKDSEEIVTGIQSEEFAWDDLVTIVNRYNYFMSEKEKAEKKN